MIRVDDAGGVKFQKIKSICSETGSGCGHPLDLTAGSENAIKFNTDTLHIRYFANQASHFIKYHWDRFNINVNFWKHLWVDTIGNFVHGGGL